MAIATVRHDGFRPAHATAGLPTVCADQSAHLSSCEYHGGGGGGGSGSLTTASRFEGVDSCVCVTGAQAVREKLHYSDKLDRQAGRQVGRQTGGRVGRLAALLSQR